VEDFSGYGNNILHSVPLEKFLTSSVYIKFPGELFVLCIWLSLKENDCLEDLGVAGRVILNYYQK
jgi:hypothetical protein